MIIDFSTVLTDLEGKDIEITQQGNLAAAPKKLTLKTVCINSLMAINDEKDGQVKFKRYQLAVKITNGKDQVDLKSEPIVMLKELIGKTCSPLVVGRAWQLLDTGER